jgi:probable addiction module antidote protein
MRQKTDYEQDLNEWLKDPENAAEYLSAAIEDGDRELLLLSLRRLAEARGGMTAVAESAHIKRESLYRALSKRGNPELRTFFNILHGLGLKVAIVPDKTVHAH